MEATGEKLLSDLRALIEDAEALLGVTTSQAGDAAAAVRLRMAERVTDARRSLAEAEALLLDKGRAAVKGADAYVKENPWNAVGIAAGVGLVLELLIRRK